jgi:hypothetical protein
MELPGIVILSKKYAMKRKFGAFGLPMAGF